MSAIEATIVKRTELCILVLPGIVDFDLSDEFPKQQRSTAVIMLASPPGPHRFVTMLHDRIGGGRRADRYKHWVKAR
ncbi:MAG TPA: hypothetical protein VGN55_09185 [Xanthobacteraceae bacterium]|jgi:hypothetical protein